MIRLDLLGYKGLHAISSLEQHELDLISEVVIGKDAQVQADFFSEISAFCISKNITWFERTQAPRNTCAYEIAIGWRWLNAGDHKIIVFHDSLLPRYRGFNPLVSALINGEKETGVTCLFANAQYDRGDIISQEKVDLHYPIKIESAIELVAPLYASLLKKVLAQLKVGKIESTPQREDRASYSLWRDEEDYRIQWQDSAEKIARFIDAVGFPYQGASAMLENALVRIAHATPQTDVQIENRTAGKVIFKDETGITVVCGEGLLKIESIRNDKDELIDLKNKFRLRFY